MPTGLYDGDWLRFEPRILSLAAWNEIAVEYASGDTWDRKRIKRSPDVAAWISQLKTSCQDHVQCGSRYYPQLARCRDGTCKTPTRDARTHSTLYDFWQ